MAQDIVVRYRLELDEALKKLDAFARELEQTDKSASKSAKSLDKTADSADKLGNEVSQASKQIKDSTKNVDDFSKKGNDTFTKLSGSVKSFALGAGAAIAAAFSVDAIIQFGKASIDAFLQAEKNAERLKFAITTIGGESEAAFQRLIDQSEELQKITVFDDDSIQQAQAALAAFGLTADEIENIIPKLADFATVAGTDLNTAVSQLGAGLEGAGRDFKKYGIEVSATATRQQNLNTILQGFGRFAGAAEDATKTLSGQLAQLQNRSDDLQETIGSKLAPVWVKLKNAIFEATLALIGYSDAEEQYKQRRDQGITEQIEGDIAAYQKLFPELTRLEAITKVLNKLTIEQNRYEKEKQDLLQKSLKGISIDTERLRVITGITLKIEDEIDALNRLTEAENKKLEKNKEAGVVDKKLSDVRIAGSDKEIKKIEALTAEYRDLLALFKLSPEQQQLLELNISSADVDKFREDVAKIVAGNPVEIPVTLEIPPDRVVEETGQKLGGSLVDSVLKRYAEEIATTQQLLGELTNLYAAFTNRQIEEINREKDARISAINESLRQNEDALAKRQISEQDAAANEKRLIEQQTRAEETAARKERELKRKQAIADKAAALVQIAINTAIGISRAYSDTGPIAGNAFAALIAALGAAQAATVAAQPIPYAKGTKKAKGGLARVGEEGEEIMYVPNGTKVLPNKQTNRYGEVLDAMFDNRFDEYVNRRYIAPALMKEKARRETNQQRSFAENIVQSAMVNPQTGLTYYDMEQIRKKGTRLTDDTIERLADALNRRTGTTRFK